MITQRSMYVIHHLLLDDVINFLKEEFRIILTCQLRSIISHIFMDCYNNFVACSRMVSIKFSLPLINVVAVTRC